MADVSLKGRHVGKKWSDLNEKQKSRYGSKDAFRQARGDYNAAQNAEKYGDGYTSTEETRMAGDKLRELKERQRGLDTEADNYDKRMEKLGRKIDRQEEKIYGDGTGNIAENYDASAAGAGGGVNRARTSKKDIRQLEDAGYSRQQIVDYLQNEGADTVKGKGAQRLLDKYVGELTETPTPTPEPSPEPGPTPSPDPSDPPGNDNQPPGEPAPGPTPTPAPTPAPTPTPVDGDDNEQTTDTLGGGGLNTGGTNTGDASTGGVSGGTNNTGGNNTQTGQVNQVGTGSVNTGGNEQNTEVNYGNDSASIGDNNSGNINIDQSERFMEATKTI